MIIAPPEQYRACFEPVYRKLRIGGKELTIGGTRKMYVFEDAWHEIPLPQKLSEDFPSITADLENCASCKDVARRFLEGKLRAYYQEKDQYEWLTQLRSQNETDRRLAVIALCDIIRKIDLWDPWWHSRLATILGGLRAEATAALPTLQQLLHHEDQRVREASLEAIKKIEETRAEPNQPLNQTGPP
jgi:hypothetical protein